MQEERRNWPDRRSGPPTVGPLGNRFAEVGAVGPARLYPSSSHTIQSDFATTTRQLFSVLRKRAALIFAVALTCFVLGALVTLMQTPLFNSTVRMQIERASTQVLDQGNVTPDNFGRSAEFLRTQHELLRSRMMAQRVVSSLQLSIDDAFLRQPTSLLSGLRKLISPPERSLDAEQRHKHAVDIVSSRVEVRAIPGSRLVNVTYKDPDPDRAAKIANAFARSFINAQVDKRFQANAYAKTFLDDRIKQLDIKLKASQKTMLDFADREKIVQTQKKTSIAEENLAAANVAFGQLVSERIRAEEAWKQVAKSDGINLPQLLSNKVIDGLRARRNELTTTYKEKRETFQPSYPSMVQQQNKIDEVERQLAREVQAVKQSLKATFDAALSQEEAMLKRIGTLRSDVLDLQKRSVRYDFLRQEVDTNRSLYDGLMKRYKEIDLAGGVAANNVFVIDQAERSSVPSSPNLPRALTLSIVLGTALGIGLALLLEGLDDRFAHPSEVEERTGLPRLGLIPFMDPEAKTFGAAAARQTAVLEAYRSVSTALQFSTDTGLPKTLAISSAGPSEGKSTTALAIASHFAALGQKVLLVDADLRKPSLHDKLKCRNHIGLSNYLIGTHAPPELLQQTQQPMLAFLASGPLPPNPSELLAGPHFEAFINNASNVFDLIVVDTPPVLGFADTQLLTTCTDATLMCVAAQQTRKGLFMNALQSLHFSRAPLVGFVFTKYNASPLDGGYDYAYGGSHRAHENTATWPPPTSHHLTDRADQSPTSAPQTGQHG